MKKLGLICAPLMAMAAVPSHAATIGNFGSAGFSYGSLSATGFDLYTRYDAGASECIGLGACARGGDTYAIIGQGSAPGSILVHPGPGAGGNSAVRFTATTAGFYNLDALARSADVGAKTFGFFSIIDGTLTTFASGSISGSSSRTIGTSRLLGAGDSIGVFVNNGNGDYYNDSTLVSGSIAPVPEPATWGMMLLGFGMIGLGLRRRSRVRTSVRYA